MREIPGEEFHCRSDAVLPDELVDAHLSKCTFYACSFGMRPRDPAQRRRVRNVRLVNCTFKHNCELGPVILDDVEVENCRIHGVCFVLGAAFRHVILRGRGGRLVIGSPWKTLWQDAVMQANREFYAGIDWALDVSEAEFQELWLYGVPAALVRRDPDSQVVIERATVEAKRHLWEALPLDQTPWRLALTNFLVRPFADEVLVAPKRSRDFHRCNEGLATLCEAGIAHR